MSRPDTPDRDPGVLNYYAVIFLDVLGQRESLRELRSLPKNPQEEEAALPVLQHTVGIVKTLREFFIKYFEKAGRSVIDVTALPEEQRALLRDLRRMEPKVRGFSDCLVISISLRDSDKNPIAINGLFSALYGLSALASLSLSLGHALRGGIDAGLATEIESGEVYGPALERAVALESHKASYPRMVVGNELLNFLRVVIRQEAMTPHQRVAVGVAKECMKLIALDIDQVPIIDFLGEGVREKADTVLQTNVVSEAYRFVVTEHERQASLHNVRLAGRYHRLRTYFESRLQRWDTEPTRSPDLVTWSSTAFWDDGGFLSDQAEEDNQKSVQSNPRWYALTLRLSAHLHSKKYSFKPRRDDPRELISSMLLTRALSTYEGAVLLAFRGMRSETEVLLRTLLEIVFMQGAIRHRPETAVELIKSDDFYRLHALRGALRAPGMLPDPPVDIPAEIQRLEAEILKHGIRGLKVAQLAEWGGYLEMYEMLYRALSRPAHVQLRDLDRHVRPDGGVILWGPEHPAARELLAVGVDALSKVVGDFAATLEVQLGNEWEQLIDEARSLAAGGHESSAGGG